MIKVICPRAGGAKSVSGFRGTITCPPFAERCDVSTATACPSNCNSRGACGSNGQCICNSGYKGPACELRACLNACSKNGQCNEETGVCACKTGYASQDCSTCADGYVEKSQFLTATCELASPVAKQCSPPDCNGNGNCNEGTGQCVCNPGYAKADCSEAQSSSGATQLNRDESKLVTSQTKGIWAYYVIPADLTQDAQSITVTVTVSGTSKGVALGGDPDVYVSTTTEEPSRTNYQWKSAGIADEKLIIPPSPSATTRVLDNDVYVGVRAYSTSTYEIVWHAKTKARCNPVVTCSGHGACTDSGSCKCDAKWFGAACSSADCNNSPGVPDCNQIGECSVATGTPKCVCPSTHTGPECKQLVKPPATPDTSSQSTNTYLLDYTKSSLTLSPGSWHHWKVTISEGSGGLTAVLTRANLRSDPMLFIRRGQQPTLTGTSTFAYSKFDSVRSPIPHYAQVLVVHA